MEAYLFLALASTLFSVQFIFTKLFSMRSRGDTAAGIWNGAVISVFTVLYLLPLCPSLALSGAALKFSLLYVCSGFLATMLNVVALRLGDLSIVTVYMLLGGMILPFFYGVFALNEPCGTLKIIAIVLLTVSLLPPFLADLREGKKAEGKSKNGKLLFHGVCFVLFLCNGMVSIATKAHSIAPDRIDATAFTLYCSLWQLILFVLSLFVFALLWRRRGIASPLRRAFLTPTAEEHPAGKTLLFLLLFSLGYAFVHGIADISSQKCAQTMDGSLQFPLLSAAIILLSALFGRLFFHEKISLPKGINLILCLAGILLFLFA